MILKRLKSNSGETITEVLAGVLIVGLATVLLATMIGVATDTSIRSVDRTTATYAQLSAVDSKTDVREITFGPAVALKGASDPGTNVNFPMKVSLKVNAISSPIADANTGYTFTRYLLPGSASKSGGGA